jgi:hypothetical protein
VRDGSIGRRLLDSTASKLSRILISTQTSPGYLPTTGADSPACHDETLIAAEAGVHQSLAIDS